MKKLICFSIVLGLCLILVSTAAALHIGNNVEQPRIKIWDYEGFDNISHINDWDPSSAGLEIGDIDLRKIDKGAGPGGLHSYSYITRVKVYSNTGTLRSVFPGIGFKTNDLFDPTTGEVNCAWDNPTFGGAPCVHGEKEYDKIDRFFGVGIAEHDRGRKYLIQGMGYRANSDAPINGTTHHSKFIVRVIDLTTRDVVLSKVFYDNAYGMIDTRMAEVKDYDGDRIDDLIVSRVKRHPTISDKVIKRIWVYDLLTGAKKTYFYYVMYYPDDD